MIFVKRYAAPPLVEREILRYAGARTLSVQERTILEECLYELEGKLRYRVCWTTISLREEAGQLDIGFAKTDSQGLRTHLAGCESGLVFAATIGLEIDRLLRRYSRISPTKALFFQAIGAERIEALCDLFCAEQAERLQAEGKALRPRFSPGYGDFPLTMQKDIFRFLDCNAKIGVSLNQSLLMSPSKSVTAIVGITQQLCTGEREKEVPCNTCQQTNCIYRKG